MDRRGKARMGVWREGRGVDQAGERGRWGMETEKIKE